MIRIARPLTPPDPKVASILSHAQTRISGLLEKSERQERIEFSARPWLAAKPLLTEIQHNKCAYCESPIGITDLGTIERFRPRSKYPLLAYDWNNLLVSCNLCSRNKRDTFPVADDDSPILLDPTVDDPVHFIRFNEKGIASSSDSRGEITIKTLGLNRASLVSERAEAIRKHRAGANKRVADDVPYAGAIRSALASIVHEGPGEAPVLPPAVSTDSVAKKKTTKKTDSTGLSPFSYIASIRIRNFRAIEDIKLNLPPGGDESQGWKVLLGENASGKSTVLKAIALALMGRDFLESVEGYLQGILRRCSIRPEATSGVVELEFVNGSKTILRLTPAGVKFSKGASGTEGTVRGYGSMRLLPESGDGELPKMPCDVGNLFHPRKSLANAEKILLDLHATDNPTFHRYASHILYLLGLKGGDDEGGHGNRREIEVREGGVWIPLHDASVRIHELSDGYQAMIALAVDLMTGFVDSRFLETAPGILLLDELGTHLHPRWRMHFVHRLRSTFKGLQVIATTHEPLCLRGLKEGEVGLLRRKGDESVELITDDLPDVEGMRADQILTCKLFGLHSTIDPMKEATFVRYYSLLAKQNLTAEEETHKRDLANQLRPDRHLASTRRDQMMYEVIDTFLAQDAVAPDRNRQRLKEETMNKLRDIWDEAGIPGVRALPR
jgi:uncharacterized protein (TIGR02646 family)